MYRTLLWKHSHLYVHSNQLLHRNLSLHKTVNRRFPGPSCVKKNLQETSYVSNNINLGKPKDMACLLSLFIKLSLETCRVHNRLVQLGFLPQNYLLQISLDAGLHAGNHVPQSHRNVASYYGLYVCSKSCFPPTLGHFHSYWPAKT